MSHPLSFTELDIAITSGDVEAFEEAVKKAKSALTDLAKTNASGVVLPVGPLTPGSSALPTRFKVEP